MTAKEKRQCRAAVAELTPRQKEILARIATGEPRKAIASELRISEKTLGTHTERMYLRLKIHSQGLAVRMACAAGLV
jgi:DNA-binding NarL/FixJ family response regulator